MLRRTSLLLAGWALLCLPAVGRAQDDRDAAAFIRALHRKYLHRNGDAATVASWVRNIENGYSPVDAHIAFAATDEYYARHGRSPERTIRGLFRDMAGRQPRAEEMRFWLRRWAQMGASSAARRGEFVKEFVNTVRPRLEPNPPLVGWMPAKLVTSADALVQALYNEVGEDQARGLHARADVLLNAAQRYSELFKDRRADPRQVREAYRALAGAYAAVQERLDRWADSAPASAQYADEVGGYIDALRGQAPERHLGRRVPPPPPSPYDR